MFIENPDPYLLPSYLISPFSAEAFSVYANLKEDDFFESYLNFRFGENNWLLTINGREAISLALDHYKNLSNSGLVSILTTTQNKYISSCVTNTIEKNTSWNREINPQTNLIFVNHEFGFPYLEMQDLTHRQIPIIEDCCTTFFSQDISNKIGKYGNYSVYSFPKFFPIQIGGILVGKDVKTTSPSSLLTKHQEKFIHKVLSKYLKEENEILERRLNVYELLTKAFKEIGFEPRLSLTKNVFPSAFLFKSMEGKKIDWNGLKTFCWAHGIQSSVFYGEDAFFVPCHQNLRKEDIQYFAFVVKAFIKGE